MSTFSQSPPGRRLASSQGEPNRSCNFRGSMNRLYSIRGKRKHGFFKSKFYSSSSSDDFSKNNVDYPTQLYAMPSNYSKDENNPPGVTYIWMAKNKHSDVHFSSISIFRTQVVSKFLPSRDAFKTFICKGLFTTHQAIQKGSLRSPMEKVHLEPLVTWSRSYFERLRLPDRNSVPGSTGIGLALSLRTLFISIFSNLKKSFGSSAINWGRHFYTNIFSMKYAFSLFLQNRLSCRPTNLNPFLPPLL
jgi:hypothetical protein